MRRVLSVLVVLTVFCLIGSLAMAAEQPTGKERGKFPSAEERFKTQDKNGDGVLEKEEFMASRFFQRDENAKKMGEEAFGKIASEKDGKKVVTLEAYKKWSDELRAKRGGKRPEKPAEKPAEK